MNKRFFAGFLGLGLFACSHLAYAEEADYTRAIAEDAVKYLHNLPAIADNLWPGLSQEVNKYPMIMSVFHFTGEGDEAGDESLYTYHFTTNDANWQKITLASETVYYMPRDIYGLLEMQIDIDHPFITVDKNPAILTGLSTDEIDNHGELAGILFSYYQLDLPNANTKIALVKQGSVAEASDRSYLRADNLSLLMLEYIILQDYLKTGDEDTLKNYVALFQSRYSALNATEKLASVDSIEFVPYNYVRFKAMTQTKEALRDKINSDIYVAEDMEFAKTAEELSYLNEDVESYVTSAVSYGLDATTPNWQQSVDKQNMPVSLILSAHYALSANEIATRLQSIKQKYGYDSLYLWAVKKIQGATGS